MSDPQRSGCGCANIPLSLLLVIIGGGYWWLIHLGNWNRLWVQAQAILPQSAQITPGPSLTDGSASPVAIAPSAAPVSPSRPNSASPLSTPAGKSPALAQPSIQASAKSNAKSSAKRPEELPAKSTVAPSPPAQSPPLRGIYLSRFHITNNADEQTIRERVRYYKSQGINTIIQGVWGNGCPMYASAVMQRTFGSASCPNLFQPQWLDWMIDEAHRQGMQVHAYFEKGIKLDQNSPIFNSAIARKWIVPGVDKTYPAIDHYVLDVEIPEVATFFRQISTEFVKRYPKIDAVQWDDYLGYHAELPGQVDRTARLTQFVLQMRDQIKQANPAVSFDLCHHNPYWAKRYFAADWQRWKIDRAFIQVYNDKNFQDEMSYVEQYGGVAIADTQLHRLKSLINRPKIQNILIFPIKSTPEQAASNFKRAADQL